MIHDEDDEGVVVQGSVEEVLLSSLGNGDTKEDAEEIPSRAVCSTMPKDEAVVDSSKVERIASIRVSQGFVESAVEYICRVQVDSTLFVVVQCLLFSPLSVASATFKMVQIIETKLNGATHFAVYV